MGKSQREWYEARKRTEKKSPYYPLSNRETLKIAKMNLEKRLEKK